MIFGRARTRSRRQRSVLLPPSRFHPSLTLSLAVVESLLLKASNRQATMKIIRLPATPTLRAPNNVFAEEFVAQLQKVRKHCQWRSLFDIVPDFGRLKFEKDIVDNVEHKDILRLHAERSRVLEGLWLQAIPAGPLERSEDPQGQVHRLRAHPRHTRLLRRSLADPNLDPA